MKQVIDWFEIPVRNFERACAFYETVLETQLHRENYAGAGVSMAVFRGEECAVKGALMSGNPALQVGASATLVYLHAGISLDAALQRVIASGGNIVMPKTTLPEGLGLMAHILDVEGNRVGLHTYA